jgi:hypothetical protein
MSRNLETTFPSETGMSTLICLLEVTDWNILGTIQADLTDTLPRHYPFLTAAKEQFCSYVNEYFSLKIGWCMYKHVFSFRASKLCHSCTGHHSGYTVTFANRIKVEGVYWSACFFEGCEFGTWKYECICFVQLLIAVTYIVSSVIRNRHFQGIFPCNPSCW